MKNMFTSVELIEEYNHKFTKPMNKDRLLQDLI